METAEQIAAALTAWTCEHSGHEPHRDYIGLSQCSLPAGQMVRQYRDGFPATNLDLLRFYKGYQMERDLLARLRAVYGERITDGGEISACNGLVKGHPDFRFDGFPGDCKTVPLDEHLPEEGRLPRRVFYQLQGYMIYSRAGAALVIYESRESGVLAAHWVMPHGAVQFIIRRAIEEAVAMIETSEKRLSLGNEG